MSAAPATHGEPVKASATQGARIVEANINACREIRREADEPDITAVIGSTGLTGERLAHHRDRSTGAVLHHALQHGDNLIGRARVHDLFTLVFQERLGLIVPISAVAAVAFAVVMAPDGFAVTVLNLIDQ